MLKKGEREAGTIVAVLTEKGANPRLFERIPDAEGGRIWHCTKFQDAENSTEFNEYLARRTARDPDLWIIELDIVNGERFIGLTDDPG